MGIVSTPCVARGQAHCLCARHASRVGRARVDGKRVCRSRADLIHELGKQKTSASNGGLHNDLKVTFLFLQRPCAR
jgi:hypothetical protein